MSECQHKSVSPGYDHCVCNDCRMIMTDSGWGRASRMWFKSLDHARYFRKHGKHMADEQGGGRDG